MKQLCFILLTLLCVQAANAQKTGWPQMIQKVESPPSILFTQVRIFDGENPVLSVPMDVLVGGSKSGGYHITSIMDGGTGKVVSTETLVIAGNGMTLMPGLIDTHTHLSGDISPPWAHQKPNLPKQLEAYVSCGITTVYELGGLSSKTKKLAKKTESRKELGPQIFCTHLPITAPGGHPIPITEVIAQWPLNKLAGKLIPQVDTPEEAREVVKKYAKKNVPYVKAICDQAPPGSPEMKEDVLRAIAEEAHAHGMKLFVHIGSADNAITAVRAGADVLAHCVYRDQLTEAQAKEIAASGAVMIATQAGFENVAHMCGGEYHADAMEQATIPASILAGVEGDTARAFCAMPVLGAFASNVQAHQADWQVNMTLLRAAGVHMLTGTDSAIPGCYPGGTFHREIDVLSAMGFSNFEILTGATSRAAKLFLEKPGFGVVLEGNRADLLLIDGNPLEDITAVHRIQKVVLNGQVITPQQVH